jgi:hypothetical protein
VYLCVLCLDHLRAVSGDNPRKPGHHRIGMDFRIADTPTDSLAKLTGEGQKAAGMTSFDLLLNPACPGVRFQRLIALLLTTIMA